MSTTDTDWIETVMQANTRIVAAQASVSALGERMLVMIEAQMDIAEASDRYITARRNLCLLRMTRDALMTGIKSGR